MLLFGKYLAALLQYLSLDPNWSCYGMCLNFQIDFKMAATLRVVLATDNASKLILPSGIPDSVEDLKTEIAKHCSFSEAKLSLDYSTKTLTSMTFLTCRLLQISNTRAQ